MIYGGENRDGVAAGERIPVTPFQIAVAKVGVVRANNAVHPFSTKLT